MTIAVKTFTTYIAGKWLFSSVRSEMFLQMPIAVKTFTTYIAGKWLFSSVRSEMFL
jgi:hypothetical protein